MYCFRGHAVNPCHPWITDHFNKSDGMQSFQHLWLTVGGFSWGFGRIEIII